MVKSIRPANGLKLRGRSAEHGFTSSKRSAEHGFTSLKRSAEHGFTSLKRSAEHGFTLLEMLVALAVFSLAALALIRLQAVSIRTTADLDERQIARIVAHNLMVEAQTDPNPVARGKSEGDVENGGRQWRWSQNVSDSGEGDIARVDVRVVAADNMAGSPAVLTFLKAQQ